MGTSIKIKPSARIKNPDIHAVERELHRIRETNGEVLEARTVWTSAQSEESPLHQEFTWDDSLAGQLYRDEQARKLIQHIVIVDTDTGVETRAWQHVVIEEISGYMPTSEVIVNAVLKEQVLAEISRDLQHARNRLSAFAGYVKQVAALDRVIKAVGGHGRRKKK